VKTIQAFFDQAKFDSYFTSSTGKAVGATFTYFDLMNAISAAPGFCSGNVGSKGSLYSGVSADTMCKKEFAAFWAT